MGRKDVRQLQLQCVPRCVVGHAGLPRVVVAADEEKITRTIVGRPDSAPGLSQRPPILCRLSHDVGVDRPLSERRDARNIVDRFPSRIAPRTFDGAARNRAELG